MVLAAIVGVYKVERSAYVVILVAGVVCRFLGRADGAFLIPWYQNIIVLCAEGRGGLAGLC